MVALALSSQMKVKIVVVSFLVVVNHVGFIFIMKGIVDEKRLLLIYQEQDISKENVYQF